MTEGHRQAHTHFNRYDKDGDGMINRAEFGALMHTELPLLERRATCYFMGKPDRDFADADIISQAGTVAVIISDFLP